MVLNFRTTIIFALLICLQHGVCLNFRFGNNVFACRAVLRSESGLQQGSRMKPDLKCVVIPNIGQSGLVSGEIQCEIKTLNSTQHYVHFAGGNCKIGRLKYSEGKLQCVPEHDRQEKLGNPFEGSWRKFTKFISLRAKDVVYFINSTRVIRNGILNFKRINVFHTQTARRRTMLETRYLHVLICGRRNAALEREMRNAKLRKRKEAFDKIFERTKRHILGNFSNSTAFPSYFPSINITFGPLSVTRTLTQNSRSLSEHWNLCPRSIVVNRSTFLVTPTAGTQHVAGLVATSKLTPVTKVIPTSVLRNDTINNSTRESIPILTVNATSRMFVHLNQSTNNSTFIYNETLVSVIHTAQDFALVSTLGCATVAQHVTTCASSISATYMTTPTITPHPTKEKAKNAHLYLGLITGGGVLLAILLFIALFHFVKRYRRIKALRRKAKQISYFNRFDCSSAWDEPDRFGGSKLSVFTLKNSKFDIDWDSSHDTK